MTEVRLITLRSAILARSVRISSCTPSAKYAFCLSSLRFSNGSTAILFSGISGAEKGDDLEMETLADLSRDRGKKNAMPMASAPIIARTAAINAQRPFAKLAADLEIDFGNRLFRPLPCLNFYGNSGLTSYPV